MRNRFRLLLGATVLFLLAVFSVSPAPLDGALCVEGTFDYDALHCYLGIHADCTECWVY